MSALGNIANCVIAYSRTATIAGDPEGAIVISDIEKRIEYWF
jgi:hypothetical protein